LGLGNVQRDYYKMLCVFSKLNFYRTGDMRQNNPGGHKKQSVKILSYAFQLY